MVNEGFLGERPSIGDEIDAMARASRSRSRFSEGRTRAPPRIGTPRITQRNGAPRGLLELSDHVEFTCVLGLL